MDPSGPNGNSHGFEGVQWCNMSRWSQYDISDHEWQFGRLHPKTLEQESLRTNLELVCNRSKNVILLYPDRRSYLLVIHNWLTKISDDLWGSVLHHVDRDLIYLNWPVSRDLPMERLPVWIKREFLSLYLFTAWEDQVEWFLPSNWRPCQNCHIIFISDLLFNFEPTMLSLEHAIGIKYTKPVKVLLPIHEKNLKKQIYLDQQSLAESIIDSLSNQPIEWDSDRLTVYSQAWIQRQLYRDGFGLRCHDLDIFPNNTLQLAELIYSL